MSNSNNHASGQAQTSHRILVVEDDYTSAITVQHLLEHIGVETDLAHNVIQAIELHQKNDYDCVVLDLMMQGVDGFDYLRRRKGSKVLADIPVIVVTAITDQSVSDQCLELNAQAVLNKPLDAEKLFHHVSTLCH